MSFDDIEKLEKKVNGKVVFDEEDAILIQTTKNYLIDENDRKKYIGIALAFTIQTEK